MTNVEVFEGRGREPIFEPETMTRRSVVKPRFRHVMSIWWLMLWRGVILALLIGGVTGAIAGVVALAVFGLHYGKDPDVHEWTQVIVYLELMFLYPLLIYMVLRKQYRRFSLKIVENVEVSK